MENSFSNKEKGIDYCSFPRAWVERLPSDMDDGTGHSIPGDLLKDFFNLIALQ